MQSLCILGRQPSLGIAELESLYGSAGLQVINQQAAIINIDPCILTLNQIGGSVKVCKILTTLDTTKWTDIQRFLIQTAPKHSQKMPKGKMYLGLSVYGLRVKTNQIIKTGLEIKKAIRLTGRPVRLIPNKELFLNSAQVIHNKLTGSNGWEIVFVRHANKTICAQTVKEQDIEAYASRDQKRPRRDMKVGMLPPKLAQIMINLARGKLNQKTLKAVCEPQKESIYTPNLNKTILDPFCGTGVILQESLLLGYSVYGTDIDPAMIENSRVNLSWLKKTLGINNHKIQLEVGDASNYRWKPFDILASELYLGPVFNALPDSETIKNSQNICNNIATKFLHNISSQVTSGVRFCLAVPAWQVKTKQFVRLPLIDHLEELGYNRVTFKNTGSDGLIYCRPTQIVGRELLILVRN